GALGDAVHHGNDDHRRWRSHTRLLDSAAAACGTGGRVPLLQSRGLLERSEVHDRKQYADGRSRPPLAISAENELPFPLDPPPAPGASRAYLVEAAVGAVRPSIQPTSIC